MVIKLSSFLVANLDSTNSTKCDRFLSFTGSTKCEAILPNIKKMVPLVFF